jgi:predicted RNA polymerase sigma factor
VATRLGIPDLLADGPRDIEELAQETGSHLPSLRRVLAALAAVGVLDKIGPRRFALTELGGGLCTGEIASAFLLPEATMAQRISRAKQSINASGVPFHMPTAGASSNCTRDTLRKPTSLIRAWQLIHQLMRVSSRRRMTSRG